MAGRLDQVKINKISTGANFGFEAKLDNKSESKRITNYNLETIKSLCTYKFIVRLSRVVRLMKLSLNRLVKG